MKLPGAEQALIDPAKARDHRLSPEHPVGRAKARFCTHLGFARERWTELRDALLVLARAEEATVGVANAFGQKYLVGGILQGPTAERSAAVVTVWIFLRGEARPRFVTAYPGEPI